ncbi:MAG: hypothetical protein M1818_001354 [Claussenomyces sp. TS43310]|nr:MAG: hypothetical protein M1818_001354 [Claussenomyces sp. TS43310]
MAPAAAETKTSQTPVSYDINLPYTKLGEDERTHARYPDYLPNWDKVWFDPLPLFDFKDPALRVSDKTKPNLLKPGVTLHDISPRMGSVVNGLQLSQLSDAAKEELALLVAERKVLAFPSQDLIDAGPGVQQEFMRFFGKPNYQPVSGSVKGYPGFHIIHRNGNREEIARFFEEKTTSTLWHQDVSYESQPPGYVMLGLLEGPEVGGDTVFSATDEAYERLSPTFRALLDPLKANHTSAKMIDFSYRNGGLVRKDAVTNVHPLVRVHPVTGKKCLFLNGEFITKIQGMKEAESKLLLNFLLQHMITGHDFQARVKWQPKSIVMFDNRSTLHSAIVDYIDESGAAQPRHIFRLCAMAEVPKAVGDA